MHEDMRLRSLVVKGPKIGIVHPCLSACEKSKTCPCDALQKYLASKAPSDVTSLEMEWMHVPTFPEVAFSKKLGISIRIDVILGTVIGLVIGAVIGGCLGNGCSSTHSSSKLKVSLSGNGYSVECRTDSVESFEKGTNDMVRIEKDLQMIKQRNNK